MPDNTVVHIGENSPEQIALKLLAMVAIKEGKNIHAGTRDMVPDKEWLLNTYAECLIAVRAPQDRSS
jgi:hypothetical protein